MPKKKYSSGNPTAKSDFYVEFMPNNSGGIKLDISPVAWQRIDATDVRGDVTFVYHNKTIK